MEVKIRSEIMEQGIHTGVVAETELVKQARQSKGLNTSDKGRKRMFAVRLQEKYFEVMDDWIYVKGSMIFPRD